MGVVGLETSLACAALALLERESRSDSSSAYQQPGAESARAMGMLGRNQIADKPRVFGWPQLIEKMSTRPAQILSLPGGSLRPGAQADIALIDPQREWTVDPEAFLSKSRNTAFAGWPLRGKVVATLLRGRATFAERNFADRAG
jgi:dihydroorotase-like cyclic amidohydrolase